MLVFHTHTCLLIACSRTHCMLAYPSLAYFDTCILCTRMLSLFHVHWGTYSVHVVVQVWWKCQCVSVSVEVSVFKGFSGRTLRNAFGNKFKALMRLERELEVQHHWIIGYSIAIPSFCVNNPVSRLSFCWARDCDSLPWARINAIVLYFRHTYISSKH